MSKTYNASSRPSTEQPPGVSSAPDGRAAAASHSASAAARLPPALRRAFERALALRRPFERALARLGLRHAALVGILALSAVLGTYRLSQNGYANTFYSAGARSMLRSLHDFLYASFDPGGLVTIDKPPLGVWAQVASAKLFGFAPLSLLLPEALMATLTVWLLYVVLAKRLGAGAALAGALALAVFPSFVAVSRDNGVDPLLILLMLAACAAALRATESGRWAPLIDSAALVGLAFNTKTLAAYLVVPGIALAYLLCAPRRPLVRVAQLALAALAMLAVSFSWIAFVELTPAHSRPFVGSSTDNTELGLTFEYNGFGRVQGEVGGPGRIPVAAGAVVLSPQTGRVLRLLPHGIRPRARSAMLPNGRYRNPIAFGEQTGPWRLFGKGLGDQGAWMLPFALAGLLALALSLRPSRRDPRPGDGRDPCTGATPGWHPAWRRDPRVATALVLGGWFLTEAVVLSFSKGIVHPYYVSALAPPAAAMVGAGAGAFVAFARRRKSWPVLLLPCAVAATVAVQLLLLHQQRYMQWFAAPLIALSALGVALMAIRRLTAAGMALTLLALSAAPAAFAATTWLAPVYGTFPAAGTHEATGSGLLGLSARNVRLDRALMSYVAAHRPARRWPVLMDASPTAAPLILMGMDAGAIAGYSGTDPALDGPTLAHMVARREARYVVLGGAYATRGGNLATRAVLADCAIVPARAWHGHKPSPHTLVLFDCAGHERALDDGPRYRDL